MPLVSIILLCYNHERFVAEALESVYAQRYPRIELLVVDDASTDNSCQAVEKFLQDKRVEVPFIKLKENRGNCAAFNQALRRTTGKYIIDLAADDVLMPGRVEQQVFAFEQLGEDFGVVFSDVLLLNEQSGGIRTFYRRNAEGELLQQVPEGDVYRHLLARQYISSPAMMMRKSMLEELDGYDESLSYEDYDLWVRSSRKYRYHFIDAVLTGKRLVQHSSRWQFYRKRGNRHLPSTLKVCHKARQLNRTPEEDAALAVSVRYHLRLSVFTGNKEMAEAFYQLLQKIDRPALADQMLWLLAKLDLPLHFLYARYIDRKLMREG